MRRLAGALAGLALVACAREPVDVPPITPTRAIATAVPDVVDAGPTDANADLATVGSSLDDPRPTFELDAGLADATPSRAR